MLVLARQLELEVTVEGVETEPAVRLPAFRGLRRSTRVSVQSAETGDGVRRPCRPAVWRHRRVRTIFASGQADRLRRPPQARVTSAYSPNGRVQQRSRREAACPD